MYYHTSLLLDLQWAMLISSICDSLCSMKNLSWRTAFAFLLIEDCCDRHEQCLVSSVCPFLSSIGVLAPVSFVRISYILLATLSAMRANKKSDRSFFSIRCRNTDQGGIIIAVIYSLSPWHLFGVRYPQKE